MARILKPRCTPDTDVDGGGEVMDIPDREGPDTDAPDEGDATGNGSKSSTAPWIISLLN